MKATEKFHQWSARLFIGAACVVGVVLSALPARAAERQMLQGHVPTVVAKLNLQPVGRLPSTNRLHLAIGLPLRNTEALATLLRQLYDPKSTNYHQYLTPQQFTERFGPTEQDYQAVINFAKANGLEVTGTYGNRVLLAVSGKVADIEKTFHITLRTYKHPTEAREFYAPDVEPSVDISVPLLEISGLNNYAKPIPGAHRKLATGEASKALGSAPDGFSYLGKDFRNAYVPGVMLDGSGQMVGLVQFDGYDPSDITSYESLAGLPAVPLMTVPVDGGVTTPGDANDEVCLDIEMVISMATNLASVVVFEAPTDSVADWNLMLGSMVASNQIKQFSSSWFLPGIDSNPTGSQSLTQMVAQGQSFFQASGDGDAWVSLIDWPADDPWVTSCGGTKLTMNGNGASYASESVWNSGYLPNQDPWPANGASHYWGSGGGISYDYSIPTWQQGISMSSNGGSTVFRNIPDVAMVADDVWVIYHGWVIDHGNYYFVQTNGSFMGTSIAAPLWAGFTALVNQQAAANGQPSVGFLNPTLYNIAQGSSYKSCFRDVTAGDNTWSNSPAAYYATNGYDLCTGLGTPNGTTLINALMSYIGAVWVDFNYTGSTQNGSYNAPFTTLSQGVAAVPASGNIWIKTSGSSPETMTITKPMTIRAFNGPATVGQ
jgi:subtilase family serine protease